MKAHFQGRKKENSTWQLLSYKDYAFLWILNAKSFHVHSLTLSNWLDERRGIWWLVSEYSEVRVRVNCVWSEIDFWHFEFLISFSFNTSEIQFVLQAVVSVISIKQPQGMCYYWEMVITFGRWECFCLLLAPLLWYSHPSTRRSFDVSVIY